MAVAVDLRFLFAHPAHFIACGLGSGLSPIAPGTAGTAFAWLSYLAIRPMFGDVAFAAFIVLSFAAGIVVCHKTGVDLGVADHGSIVWDEIVPFWAVLAVSPAGLAWQGVAFLAFRFFDIVKPPPAGWIDGNVKNGLGVMSDDAFAALYAALVVLLLQRLVE